MRHTDESKPTGDICVCECDNASWYYEKAKKNKYPIRGELWVCEGGGIWYNKNSKLWRVKRKESPSRKGQTVEHEFSPLLPLLLLAVLLWHSRIPVDHDTREDIKADINPQQTQVPPALRVLDAYRIQECVGFREVAELAGGGSVWVVDSSAG
jgi:hypothetical protein